jgi:hypothetical protein
MAFCLIKQWGFTFLLHSETLASWLVLYSYNKIEPGFGISSVEPPCSATTVFLQISKSEQFLLYLCP